VACWRTKAAVSLKRVKTAEKLLWTAYRNSPTLFRIVPSPTPYGLPFLEIGGLQFSYPLLSQERVKLRTSNLGDVFTWPFRIEARLKILEKRECGRIQGLSKFFGYPLISRERVKLRTSNLASTFSGPIRIKDHKNFGEKGAWTYPGAAKIFWVPPIISGTGKASNFVRTFIGWFETKAHEKFWE